MSWAAYLDNLGDISQGYITDLKGNVWGTPTKKSPDQKATPEELRDICSHVVGGDSDYFHANGIKLGGTKFVTVSFIDNTLKGKKGHDSVVVLKCIQCIIIVHAGSEVQLNDMNARVGKMSDHLMASGY